MIFSLHLTRLKGYTKQLKPVNTAKEITNFTDSLYVFTSLPEVFKRWCLEKYFYMVNRTPHKDRDYLPAKEAIYYIQNNDSTLYVGQTTHLWARFQPRPHERLQYHKSVHRMLDNGFKEEDLAIAYQTFEKMPISQLLALEEREIKRVGKDEWDRERPPYNFVYKKNKENGNTNGQQTVDSQALSKLTELSQLEGFYK